MEPNHQRNSMKLNIEAVRLSDDDQVLPKESYKTIPEYPASAAEQSNNSVEKAAFDGAAVKNSNMVRENNDHIEDGAGDAMLAANDKEQLSGLNNEVKFIPAEHKNGDAKIDIGNLEKAFTGMTKEELMRYANDPFWVRLRWIFFILFWALWIAMLVGAVLIIVDAPKCAAPSPLAWFKQGPLGILSTDDSLPDAAELQRLQAAGARGAIFSVPVDETYQIGNGGAVDEKIRKIVAALQEHKLEPIADVTPNFVTDTDPLWQSAAANASDTEARDAFVFAANDANKVPNNWLSLVSGSAWQPAGADGKSWALAQFGAQRFDLQLNAALAKDKFKAVLRSLATLGVHGVRLHNAKHFIVSRELRDEQIAGAPTGLHTEYGHFQHTQTTYQAGLGDLLAEFAAVWHNETAAVVGGGGFLSLAEDIGRQEAFRTKDGHLAVELPIVGTATLTLASGLPDSGKQLFNELSRAVLAVGNQSWVQWVYADERLAEGAIGRSEYNAFLMLLPGVPVTKVQNLEVSVPVVVTEAPVTEATATETPVTVNSTVAPVAPPAANGGSFVARLEELRQRPSYMYGSFNVFTAMNETVVAYSRIKSGNPGYFVAYNPTDDSVKADFSKVDGIPEELTVHLLSHNYRVQGIVEKGKVQSSEIPIDARSVIILTYVPKSS